MTHLAIEDAWKSSAEKAARSAGELLRSLTPDGMSIISNSDHDLKSEADLRANETIISILGETNLPILSEESAQAGELETDGPSWIIDPLDGTVNFLRGSPLNCVSIALWANGGPIYGCIYDFFSDLLFQGGIETPATCNHSAIRCSDTQQAKDALLATGFPNQRNYGSDALLEFCACVQNFKKVRLLGSAALSLAWVSRGWVDAYKEEDIYLWDIAAGLAIAQAAGCHFNRTKIDPVTFKLTLAVASSEGLLNELA